MIDEVVTITGPPGSGKSTAGRGVAQRLGLEYVSAGSLFREEARRRGLSLAEFSRYAEQHEEADRALDQRVVALAQPGRLLEGRVTGALLRRAGVRVVYLVVTARPEVRHERLARRDGVSLAEAIATTEAREASERSRYERYYGLDLAREPADLTVDSTDLPPEAVVDRLVSFLERRRPGGPAR